MLHQWDCHPIIRNYVHMSPRFEIKAEQGPRRVPAKTAAQPWRTRPERAVIAFYHPSRDEGWLAPFLATLRLAGYGGSVHCIGLLGESELGLLSQFGCIGHFIETFDEELDVESVAHLHLSRVLDALAGSAIEPGQVLVLDSVRASFLRDPFRSETIGLSVFQESATRIVDSEFNLHRVAMFTTDYDGIARNPVVSSALLRGGLDVIRTFYRRLFVEFIGREELLRTHKAIQGAFNKLCHGGGLGMPVIQHPNGAEAYLEIWEAGLPIETIPSIRIGGAVPFAVLNPVRETELMRMLKTRINC